MSSQAASMYAARWVTCLAGMMPGVSRSWSSGARPPADARRPEPLPPPTAAQVNDRVTPARFSDRSLARPTSLLIRADLPTFGKPSTHARTARGRRPLRARLAFTWAPARSTARLRASTPLPSRAFTQWKSCTPSASRCRVHACTADCGTQSARLSASTWAREPTHWAMSGCRVDSRMRASRSSTTTSTILSTSCSCFSARAMCPGYQLITGRPSQGASGAS
mmetsp:Transcript_12759/g.43196  ORF Transcript_12759/g.43196 Transcript_12759/m.43196 type:complete len:222 (+) Transcript_12759:414-1079(+)